MGELSSISLVVIAALLVLLFIRILRMPLRLLFKLLVNAAVGFVTLFVVNYLGAFIGLELPVTPLTCVLAGVLGIPGVLLMAAYLYFL